MYISDPTGDGYAYVAERPRRSVGRVNGLAWSRVPIERVNGFERIPAEWVPKSIRRQAYRLLAKTWD